MTEQAVDARAWIGRQTTAIDTFDPRRIQAMHATLNLPGHAPADGQTLPPLWHWLYFWEVAPHSGLGYDGHAAKGDFLPPIDLPRRMWAGSRITFRAPLRIGAEIQRHSEILDVALKTGRSGRLGFVTVRHRLCPAGDTSAALEEEHDIVYREPPSDEAPARPGDPAPVSAPWSMELVPDPVLLFRYSALTFNGHRIHYDRPFAVEREGYSGLIVHGPLLATFMAQLAVRSCPGMSLATFAFRALRPVFDTRPFVVAGTPIADGSRADVWVADSDGYLAMKGDVTFVGSAS